VSVFVFVFGCMVGFGWIRVCVYACVCVGVCVCGGGGVEGKEGRALQ